MCKSRTSSKIFLTVQLFSAMVQALIYCINCFRRTILLRYVDSCENNE